jgi:DDE superfamily endonuclease
MEKLLDFYTDYLISSTCQTSATGLSRLLDNEISHDTFTRFLTHSGNDSKSLWQSVKPLVRANETDDACLVFDDCIIEKQYTDENALIAWHYDHAKGRNVKGINLLTAFYVSQSSEQSVPLRVPVMFELVLKTVLFCVIKTKKETRQSPITKNEMMQSMITQSIHNQLKFKYILADSWFASSDNMHFIEQKKKYFIFDLQQNRLAILADGVTTKPTAKSPWKNIKLLDIPNNTPVSVWLKDMDFPVLLTKQVFTDGENRTQGVRFLVSNDFSLTDDQFTTIYKKRWSVEEYHKSLKQNVSIAKSPTRTVKTQTNHIYCAIWAYIKLEKLRLKTKLSHFEIKAKIYIKAIDAAYTELLNIKAKYAAA